MLFRKTFFHNASNVSYHHFGIWVDENSSILKVIASALNEITGCRPCRKEGKHILRDMKFPRFTLRAGIQSRGSHGVS